MELLTINEYTTASTNSQFVDPILKGLMQTFMFEDAVSVVDILHEFANLVVINGKYDSTNIIKDLDQVSHQLYALLFKTEKQKYTPTQFKASFKTLLYPYIKYIN